MKQNLLFITTDQQRFDSLKAYGFKNAKTPNLDKLCEEGTVFDNCYVSAPVCVACRSSMMTGLYPSVTGTLNNESWLEDFIPTWPDIFSKAGIKTVGIGKMHFAPWDTLSGFQERIICEDKRHYYIPDDHAKYLEENGLKRISPVQFPGYQESAGAPYYPYAKEFYPDVFIAERACDWIDKNASNDMPFAAWVSFTGPHDPYDPPIEYKHLYSEEEMKEPIPEPEDASDKTAYNICMEGRFTILRDLSVFQCDYLGASKKQMKHWRKNYMTNISIIDEGIGKIIDTLKRKSLWENTTVVFTSDHGDALGDHGLVFKMFFYESMVKVPLIVKGPGIPANERRKALVSTCDLVPFFFETGDIEATKHTQGRSISNIIEDPENINHDVVFSEMKGWYMAFDGRYKLSYFKDRSGELYDLETDPDEMINVINDPLYEKVRCSLLMKLIDHMDECNVIRTRLSNKTACERRAVIDKAFKEGKDIFNLY